MRIRERREFTRTMLRMSSRIEIQPEWDERTGHLLFSYGSTSPVFPSTTPVDLTTVSNASRRVNTIQQLA